MSLASIDPNLACLGVNRDDIKWYSSRDPIFSTHGVLYDEERKIYTRVPCEVAKTVSNSVFMLSHRTAGGRVRFVTDSPYIALRASMPAFKPATNISITASHGFSLYIDGQFNQRFSPSIEDMLEADYSDPFTNRIRFSALSKEEANPAVISDRLIEIYLPLYGGLCDLQIGLIEGSTVKPAPEYIKDKPLVFYGSSITQGAGVSRPGNDYVSLTARMLNRDYINLGFSGSGNAEREIIDYMLSIDASLYAFDYNLYDSRPERVLPPHYELYKYIREKRPNAAILLCDKPYYDYDTTYERRHNIIKATYERAIAEGDELVAFLEAKDMFGSVDRGACVADASHPNDLGAYRIASVMSPMIEKLLSKRK